MRASWRRHIAIGSAATLLVLGACGDDDDDDAAADEPATEAGAPEDEVAAFCRMLWEVYADFGFTDILVKLADRPPQRVGDDASWDQAEAALHEACKKAGIAYEMNSGDGAFYGPKLEFTLLDSLGRHWQCGTIQVDYNLPGLLGAEYVGSDSGRHAPVMP